jgi:hypothetical protein
VQTVINVIILMLLFLSFKYLRHLEKRMNGADEQNIKLLEILSTLLKYLGSEMRDYVKTTKMQNKE